MRKSVFTALVLMLLIAEAGLAGTSKPGKPAKPGTPSRKPANGISIVNAEQVFRGFLACKPRSSSPVNEEALLRCAGSYLHSSISDFARRKYAAWLLMDPAAGELSSCSDRSAAHYHARRISETAAVYCFMLGFAGEAKAAELYVDRDLDGQLRIQRIFF